MVCRYFVSSHKDKKNYCIEFVNREEAETFANNNVQDNISFDAMYFDDEGKFIKNEILMEPKQVNETK